MASCSGSTLRAEFEAKGMGEVGCVADFSARQPPAAKVTAIAVSTKVVVVDDRFLTRLPSPCQVVTSPNPVGLPDQGPRLANSKVTER
jgi:hypothetical protein